MEEIYWLMSPLLNILRYNIGIGEGFGCSKKLKKVETQKNAYKNEKEVFLIWD